MKSFKSVFPEISFFRSRSDDTRRLSHIFTWYFNYSFAVTFFYCKFILIKNLLLIFSIKNLKSSQGNYSKNLCKAKNIRTLLASIMPARRGLFEHFFDSAYLNIFINSNTCLNIYTCYKYIFFECHKLISWLNSLSSLY